MASLLAGRIYEVRLEPTVTSVDNSTGATCKTCTFGAGLDFQNFLYYVEVTINRISPGVFPQANTLRLF